ncbi:glycoside hydrolase family 95 protein [Sphingobacterium corticibacterium]|uniref:Glycoside hydrolase family 95 protein n=1 Tax=Sphingobacterium corticibacterium TaxID=2484746 RepID=A0A4Q6Y0T5_9SPHI|nr:glycoside hydrolase family 95 protein [Sphingobacterium corticibacterium]RZF62829.1 glycoside hydrolase family 95 protein [Sphingobacterium corticibacterium]
MYLKPNIKIPLLFVFMGVLVLSCTAQKSNELTLRYNSPANMWEETLPLGNGRIGMMPDGAVDTELVVLNDISMWSGSEDPDALNPTAFDHLEEIRKLLLSGKNMDAQNLMYAHFRSGGLGSAFGKGKDAPYGCFQMLGNMHIRYMYPQSEETVNYQRKLSLNDAVASTQFTKGNTTYSREYFASHAHDILGVRILADKKKSISFEVRLSRPERATIRVSGNTIFMEGQLNDGYNTDKGIRYLTKLQIVNKGGELIAGDSSLQINNADEAVVLISTSTDMLDENYKGTVDNLLTTAKNISFNKLKQEHIATYKNKFNRVELDLGVQDNVTPTNERLINFQSNDDPAFAALYFQFGRYLMISGTNENSLPLNLQGLWANQIQTPWNGDYHLNINVQMNYWPVEVCNLSELHRPLIDFTTSLVPSGEATARKFYDADGWVAHMMSNPWKFTAPGEHASWGATNTGGAWLCAHLWEHYSFTEDKSYLRSIYPVLTGAAQFFLSSMIAEPEHGWLVTAPSSSPENAFYLSGDSVPIFVCMGPTMDVQIISELFSNILSAAEILDIEDGNTAKIREVLAKLPPMQISEEGYLQEWLQDYREVDPNHRHVSHLYGLYPSNQISPETTPELAAAARETLNRRGDDGTGWSRAWKVNFWSRLQDGNRAYKLLKSLLEPTVGSEIKMSSGGGTYNNLFCSHPPFQIDGNFGGTAGIAEMLLQSHNGYIELLPALPDAWLHGNVKGLRARGGAEMSIQWKDKKITSLMLKASVANTFKLKVPAYISSIKQNGKSLTIENGFITLELDEGKETRLTIYPS